MCLRELLQWGIGALEKTGIGTARLDAEVLLAYVLNKDRIELLLDDREFVAEEAESLYKALIGKRVSRTPVSYLTKHREFMSLDFLVNESVLIPRPDTEILVETVCKMGKPGSRVLELGIGSGAIAVSLARYNEDWRIVATDLSMDALLVAKENARRNGVIDRISFVQMDLFDGLGNEQRQGKSPHPPLQGGAAELDLQGEVTGFDWVVSNPPYIPSDEIHNLSPDIREFEPILALDGGLDGLDVIREILSKAYKILKPDGRLAMEMGYGQSERVKIIADGVGRYSNYSIIKDYSGIPRVFCCQIGR